MSITNACDRCGDDSQPFLHYIWHFKNIKRFCTNCVIHFNRFSFCPICLVVHKSPNSLTLNDVVSCVRCYSFSHISCVDCPKNPAYICPMCINPDSPLFTCRDLNGGKKIDLKSAKLLLIAAEISASGMKKVSAAAKMNAEVKVKEAVDARKKASECLEEVQHLDDIMAMQKVTRGESESGAGAGAGAGDPNGSTQ